MGLSSQVLHHCFAHGARVWAVSALGMFLPDAGNASTTFGIFDARTMAMGGTSVASANNDNAQFYNSALLAFNDEIEERTQDSRFWFPLIAPQISDSAIDAEEIHSDDVFDNISANVAAFNVTPTPENAQAVLAGTRRIENAFIDIAGEELFTDIYLGTSLSEPGKFQGAGFFLGVRLLGSGEPAVTDTDLATLQAYREGLEFIASEGTQGAPRPEIFDANGALIDPGNNLDSSVAAAGVAITEIGVAMSANFQFRGHPLAAGWSFKAVGVETFEDNEQFADRRIDIDDNSETRSTVNVDIGLVRDFENGWRLGLAVKDVIPFDFETSLGTEIQLRPRPRLGVSYQRGKLQFAADADLVSSRPLATERGAQEIAFGTEWTANDWLRLRAGYRHDVRGKRRGVASFGIGTLWRRFALDIAYSQGEVIRAAALQFGVAF